MRLWLSFADLRDGDRFRFVYNATSPVDVPRRLSESVFVKGPNGWYRKAGETDARAWRTGRHTAVQPEPAVQQ